MKKSKKLAIVLLSTALVAAVLIGGTLAYFTDSKELENTVTLGHVQIRLDEPRFEDDTQQSYRMDDVLPTQTIVKDPTITVADDSAPCYLRVKIEVSGFDKLPADSTMTAVQYQKELENALQVVTKGADIVSGNSVSLNAVGTDGKT